ncbi:uncharacterized protein EI97DRAFT_433060 [Westerdykella ornata]|uniref:BZIP domain-containing protein n=1 Tax=Westerdykella ornata TaxID=318751 RepID=A0A6A6JK01_WESOR|nr:uncharacterized protein EI97DRAFT_433060 [Westerdykella ornata]KAF2276827.1 hypothetical protein EI97DRAFT_433060 [Westerdykella ornata]
MAATAAAYFPSTPFFQDPNNAGVEAFDEFLNLDDAVSNPVMVTQPTPSSSVSASTTAANLWSPSTDSNSYPMGPSRDYDHFPQQTPLPSNYLFSPSQDIASLIDINGCPPDAMQTEEYIQPSAITRPPAAGVGTLRPGDHQKALLAQQQAQQAAAMQRRQSQQQAQAQLMDSHPQNTHFNGVNDTAERTISRVLQQFRQEAQSSTQPAPRPGAQDTNREEDDLDMDADEKFLNSEEGKKLSSKERRQLRNKVSARHFRTRRKAMIESLENAKQESQEKIRQLEMENQQLRKENASYRVLLEELMRQGSLNPLVERMASSMRADAPAPSLAHLPLPPVAQTLPSSVGFTTDMNAMTSMPSDSANLWATRFPGQNNAIPQPSFANMSRAPSVSMSSATTTPSPSRNMSLENNGPLSTISEGVQENPTGLPRSVSMTQLESQQLGVLAGQTAGQDLFNWHPYDEGV